MKRILTLMLACTMTLCMMAQMKIWYNGNVVYQRNYTLIDSITFTIQETTPETEEIENLPAVVEQLLGTPDNEMRSYMQAKGYALLEEDNGRDGELSLFYVNSNQDTVFLAFVQSNLLTDVTVYKHYPANNAIFEAYKAWSATVYSLSSWSSWNGYIKELSQSDWQVFSGHTLFANVLNNMPSASAISEDFNKAIGENFASLSYKRNSLVTRVVYARSYHLLDVQPTSITLPDTIRVMKGKSVRIPYTIQPVGALHNAIVNIIDDPSIAEIEGERIAGRNLGTTTIHVTCGTIQTSAVIKCVPYIEDGMYIIGEATSILNLESANAAQALMGAGINEVEQSYRYGMYEKYVALEAGKLFEIVLFENNNVTHYGAQLVQTDIETDYWPTMGYKGLLAENVQMRVPVSGLYHIILDMNAYGDLPGGAQVIVVPCEWEIRGAMNGWGCTAAPTPAFNKETMTWTWTDVLMKQEGQFKFTHGCYWKCQMDDAGWVKAESSIGADGYNNFEILPGYYTITLTWNMAGGAVGNSFVVNAEKTADYSIDATSLVISLIGTAVANRDWASDLDFVYEGEENGVYTYAATNVTMYQGEFKVRVDHDWNTNFGWYDMTISGDVTNIADGGGNIAVLADKTYSKIAFKFTFENNMIRNPQLVFTE